MAAVSQTVLVDSGFNAFTPTAIENVYIIYAHFPICERSVGTTELHYSTKKRYHVLDILKSLFSSDTRQSMKRRIATER